MNTQTSSSLCLRATFFALIFGAWVSAPVLAESKTFHATVKAYSDIQIRESKALNFGEILPDAGASCSMDNQEQVQGQCNTQSHALSSGVLLIQGLPENQSLSIRVTGSATSQLDYQARFDVLGAQQPHLNTPNGQTLTVIPALNSPGLNLVIYGDMQVSAPLELDSEHHIAYQVEVNFQ